MVVSLPVYYCYAPSIIYFIFSRLPPSELLLCTIYNLLYLWQIPSFRTLVMHHLYFTLSMVDSSPPNPCYAPSILYFIYGRFPPSEPLLCTIYTLIYLWQFHSLRTLVMHLLYFTLSMVDFRPLNSYYAPSIIYFIYIQYTPSLRALVMHHLYFNLSMVDSLPLNSWQTFQIYKPKEIQKGREYVKICKNS